MKIFRLILLLLAAPFFSKAQYKVSSQIKYPVQPTMWGLFFEDINRSGDGGVYADLIKNRSFDFPDPMMGWITSPSRRQWGKSDMIRVINQSVTDPDNPKYLQVILEEIKKVTLTNESFGGMAIKKGLDYEFIMDYRLVKDGVKVKVDILSGSGKILASAAPDLDTSNIEDWNTVNVKLSASDTTHNGRLVVTLEGEGTIEIDRVSLFPTDTWKGREEGLRNDLVQKLADIKPGFLRFPGGCIVEGKTVENRYQWKNTIGALNARKLIANQWQEGAAGKPLPDYFQSFGLGFYEYFEMCEDLGTEPLPILNCGLSCQFDAAEVVPMDQLDPYVQDALDLIEFANGDVNSKWGARRVAMGHFEPFKLKMIGIGNENWGPQYVERLDLFTKAIKEKYPDIQIITSTGYSPNAQFRYMDSVLRAKKVDIIDEHYYQTPNWFLMNAGKYDNYDRKGPRIFLGEYACHSIRIGSPDNKNTLFCALAEAAFMTGLERNADIVTMAAYAPLFAHVKDWQWTPNLIWFDNSTCYATPSYYVQQLFSHHKGSHVISMTENGRSISGNDSIWANAVIDIAANEVIIKLVNPSSQAKMKTIEFSDLKKKNPTGTVTVLKGRPDDVNSIEQPEAIVPVTSDLTIKGKKAAVSIEPWSFTVIRIKGN